MTTNGVHPQASDENGTRPIRSSRLRGVMRHDWLNDGIEAFPLATRIHWSASIADANTHRAKLGLSPLDPNLDPAPDVAAGWSPSVEPSPFTHVLAVDGRPVVESSAAGHRAVAVPLAEAFQWSGSGRLLTFLLAATSIGCMLVDNIGLITTRSFFFAVLAPACLGLFILALVNRAKGDGRLFRAVASGALAGLGGAFVFNIFRLPFVFSPELGLERLGIPHVPFFNLYPRIGAVLLGQSISQPSFDIQNYFVGWGYHLIRAMTTGIMFAAAIGEIKAEINASTPHHPISVRAVIRGALLTVAIQSCLLLSPYATLFSIELTPKRVFIILLAHVSFGMSIALFYAWRSGSLVRPTQPQMA